MNSSARLRHVVLFGFKTGATESQIAELVARFRALKDLIPGIDEFECGLNSSPEGKNQGHSHCFVLTFGSEAARDSYLPHPSHQEFVAWAHPLIEKGLVVDYWAG